MAKRKSVLVITPNAHIAEKIQKELNAFELNILEFPAWETLPHEKLSPSSETIAKRVNTLNQLRNSRDVVVITPVRQQYMNFQNL